MSLLAVVWELFRLTRHGSPSSNVCVETGDVWSKSEWILIASAWKTSQTQTHLWGSCCSLLLDVLVIAWFFHASFSSFSFYLEWKYIMHTYFNIFIVNKAGILGAFLKVVVVLSFYQHLPWALCLDAMIRADCHCRMGSVKAPSR